LFVAFSVSSLRLNINKVMKKMIVLAFCWGVLCSFFCAGVEAQGKLYMCSGYTPAGEPVGNMTIISIPDSGLRVYMLYVNEEKIGAHVISVFVDKAGDNGFEEFSSDVIHSKDSQTWVAKGYLFRTGGSYKIAFLDEGYQELAVAYITVTNKTVKQDYVTETVSSLGSEMIMREDKDKCTHCAGVKVHICESVLNEKPVNDAAVFTVPDTSSFLYILVENIAGFAYNYIVIDLYKTDGGKSIYVRRVECPVQKGKDIAWLKYVFANPGNYNFVVYNEEMQPIGYKDVAINYEKASLHAVK